MPDPQVGIIVLNWNGAADTLACLASLQKLSYPKTHILVVDNGSQDDSVDRIQAAFPHIELLALPENLLFGGGNNAGLQHLANRDLDYVCFLNNDTEVRPDFLEPLVAAIQQDETIGMVAPRILYHGSDRIWYDGGNVNLWTGRVDHVGIREQVSERSTVARVTEYITGCCLMMPTALAMELEGFDPRFRMYAEDVDLSLRVRSKGLKLMIVPESVISHKVSASMGGAFTWRKLRRKARGLCTLYRRHLRWYQWPSLVVAQPFLLMGSIFAVLRSRSKGQTA